MVFQNIYQTYKVNFDSDQLDTEGDSITHDTVYTLSILSVGTFYDSTVYALSHAFDPITLSKKPVVKTLAINIGANDGVSVDKDGNIYVSDYGSYYQATYTGTGKEVKKISAVGKASSFMTDLVSPLGSVFENSDKFYVTSGSNFSSGTIIKRTPDGTQSTLATIPQYPSGITKDINNNLFVANYWNSTVSKIDPEGMVTVFAKDTFYCMEVLE